MGKHIAFLEQKWYRKMIKSTGTYMYVLHTNHHHKDIQTLYKKI